MGLFKASLDASELRARRPLERDRQGHRRPPASRRHAPGAPRLRRHAPRASTAASPSAASPRARRRCAWSRRRRRCPPLTVSILINLARCHGSLEQGDEAVADLATRAAHVREDQRPRKQPQTASVLTELGIRERHDKHYAPPSPTTARRSPSASAWSAPTTPTAPPCTTTSATCCATQKRYDESQGRARARHRHLDARRGAPTARPWPSASAASARWRWTKAIPPSPRATSAASLEIRRKKRPPGHPDITDSLLQLGDALADQKKPEALTVLEEAARRHGQGHRRHRRRSRRRSASRSPARASSSACAPPAPTPMAPPPARRSTGPSGRTPSATARPGSPNTRRRRGNHSDRPALRQHPLLRRQPRRRRRRRHPARRRRRHADHLSRSWRTRSSSAATPSATSSCRTPRCRGATRCCGSARRSPSRISARRTARTWRAPGSSAAWRRRSPSARAFTSAASRSSWCARRARARCRRSTAPRRCACLDPTGARASALLTDIALSGINVLILGETGVGKEVLAETLHRLSRRTGAFVRVNCAAIAPALDRERALRPREGRLHRRRAAAASGLLEAAEGGTVFLDEVGELPLDGAGQAPARASSGARSCASARVRPDRARRALRGRDQPRSVERDRRRPVPQRPLLPPRRRHARRSRRCASGAIRSARWRCSSSRRRTPSARRRRPPQLAPDVLEHLRAYEWPGNVRELKAVARARAAAGARRRDRRAPPGALAGQRPLRRARRRPKRARPPADVPPIPLSAGETEERQRILAALEHCNGNQTRAAKQLGISRATLVNRLSLYRIPRPRK